MDPAPKENLVFNENKCVICRQDFQTCTDSVQVTRGLSNLIIFSEVRGQLDLCDYLRQRSSSTPCGKVLVHEECRRIFVDKKRLKRPIEDGDNETSSPKKQNLRSGTEPFQWKVNCFFCNSEVKVDKRHPQRKDSRVVHTIPFRAEMLAKCQNRQDTWSKEVGLRLQDCFDLVAAEAVYHKSCHSRFCSEKYLAFPEGTPKSAGRRESPYMIDRLNKLCEWLEREAELYTIAELHTKMIEIADSNDVYSLKRLKQKLQDRYKDFIFFAEIDGRKNVVCFRNMANYIINEKWYEQKLHNIEDESDRIVLAAAKIIKAQIREMSYPIDKYPTSDHIRNGIEWLPHSLRVLMENIVSSDTKQASIGQCIVQAARPRTIIPPLLFGLGVELDHAYGSKWLINELARLGYSITYDEVTRFKQSVVHTENFEALIPSYPVCFTQWVGDNVDHNVATLDGHETFHGMGVIAVSTFDTPAPRATSKAIERLNMMPVETVVENKGIPIQSYDEPDTPGLSSTVYKPLIELQFPYVLPLSVNSDLLWHASWYFSNSTRPRPNWLGFMQDVSAGNHPPPSHVQMLPIIDKNPSDETCIYSTLMYAQSQAQLLNIPTPCITFDQPLWRKAVEIIDAKSLNIVCRLGGFHTMMSFLGSIGSLMEGSGLSDLLETVYGVNAVAHMMSGKAVSRAIRGHFLVEAALMARLLESALPRKSEQDCNSDPVVMHHGTTMVTGDGDDGGGFTFQDEIVEVSSDTNSECHEESNTTLEELDCDLDDSPERLKQTEVEELRWYYEQLSNHEIDVESIGKSPTLLKLKGIMEAIKHEQRNCSRTAKLWLTYMEYIDTLKLFIRAERTGDWNMHIIAVSRMLNLFAATGHFNYAKSARLYLQAMLDLPSRHPWLYAQFAEYGYHTVRRSDRYWAGLWTDLTIEQVMMRSIKSRGGLTRGRGMTDTVRLLWVYSMHKCAEMHEAMTDVTGLVQKSSEQHVELGTTRCNRDFEDLNRIFNWLAHHDPFDVQRHELRSLSSGLTASDGDGVNCDEVEEVGLALQEKLDNVKIHEASMKRREKVRTLIHLTKGIKIDQHTVHVDPLVLFSRLLVLLERCEDTAPYFQYELTPSPTSLFKDSAMRKPNKAVLAKTLTSGLTMVESVENTTYVLDGGALLHRVRWMAGKTYKEVIMQYLSYVRSKYGLSSIIFDGYASGPSVKDHEHQRRASKASADVQISEEMQTHRNQQLFLANEKNKTQFIKLLSHYLRLDGHDVTQSESDADTQIVSAALGLASSGQHATVVADDTDVLVLLIFHWNTAMADIHLRSEPKKAQKRPLKLTSIREAAGRLEKTVLDHLLVIHAWGGCDTTSAVFGQGKCTILKHLQKSQEVRQWCETVEQEGATQDAVGEAGSQIFVTTYGGKPGDTLTKLRHARYREIAATTSSGMRPERLPPTEGAAFQHSLRVHLQVVVWKSLNVSQIEAREWGWMMENGRLTPIMTDKEPAPSDLLQYVRCKCKTSSRNPCSTNLCSCRKSGLRCVTACRDCRGEECQNAAPVQPEEDEIPEYTHDKLF